MADSKLGLYLIAYDIADPKRLCHVHRILKKEGLPVQYSVFTVVMTRPRCLRLLERLQERIELREDDIRCYRLPENTNMASLGKQYFPNDVMLFTGGINRVMGESANYKDHLS